MSPLSKYEFEKYLGSGCFGTVWLAVERETEKKFAIKEIRNFDPDVAGEEVAILERTNHGTIIKYFESFYSANLEKLYIVMEYADGGTFESHVLSNRHSTKEYNIWRAISHISGALNYLHTLKPVHILHRDIKPANVLGVKLWDVVKNSWGIRWKLADFGIAKMLTQTAQEFYYTDTCIGTETYMAPEVFCEFAGYSFPADVWSLGALISFYCNGRHLFNSEEHVCTWKLSNKSMPDHYSQELKSLVSKMLHPNELGRPSADAVHKECNVGDRKMHGL